MPRAATAIIAIACSASYLSGDSGAVPVHALRCAPKGRRGRSGNCRHAASKQSFAAHCEETEEQDGAILAHLGSQLPVEDAWGRKMADIRIGGEASVISPDGQFLTPSLSLQAPETDGDLLIGTLPEELLLQTLAYVGTSGRTVCRAGRRCHDSSAQGLGAVPVFPVQVCVKQHCYFGSDPVTTTWNFSVAGPTSPSLLQFGIDCAENQQGNAASHQSGQSGEKVLSLCRELRALQTALGVTYKEDGRTQVQVVANDAAGHTLLEHSYQHRIFNSKADDLLELLAEAEPQAPKAEVNSENTVLVGESLPAQVCGTSCMQNRRAARSRPFSRTRSFRS